MRVSVDGIDYEFPKRVPSHADRSFQFLLVRLLLGTVRISRGSRVVHSQVDHSIWPSVQQSSTGARAFDSYLVTYGVGRAGSAFVRETIADNRKLFQDLLSEFSNYFVEKHRGSHTAGFVFLYRALERLSFSIPLLYCSTSNDFVGTFNDLKELFKDGGAGELGLLNKFLKQGRLIDRTVLDSTCTIDFSTSSHGTRFYGIVTGRYSGFDAVDPTRLQVEISYKNVPALFALLRNRFFHFRSGDGQRNIGARDLHDSDAFFELMNPVFCDFLGLLTLHAIAWKYKA